MRVLTAVLSLYSLPIFEEEINELDEADMQ